MKKQQQPTTPYNEDNEINFSDDDIQLSNNFINEDDSEISDNEGYEIFLKEYKQFYKSSKKHLKSKVNSTRNKRLITLPQSFPSLSLINHDNPLHTDNPSNLDNPIQINIPDLLSQANNYYISNKHDEAIEILRTIIAASPDLQEPYQILSQIYEERNDIKKALSFLMLAAQLSNGDINIWIRCCYYNHQIGNLQQAEYCITRALKLQKKNVYILYIRGNLNEEMGNLYKAGKIYETLLSYHSNAEILVHTAKLYEKLDNCEKSMQLLEMYYDKVNKKTQCLILLYDYYIKKEQFMRGVKLYNTIITKNSDDYSNNSILQVKRLFCFVYVSLTHKDDDDDARLNVNDSQLYVKEIIDNFISIVNIDYDIESVVENLHMLFYILQGIQQISLFIDIYDEIKKHLDETFNDNDNMNLNAFDPDIFAKIGEYFFNAKDYNKSITYYTKSLSLKNDDLIRVKLSELYGLIGEHSKALDILINNNNVNNDDGDNNIINSNSNIREQHVLSNNNDNTNNNEHLSNYPSEDNDNDNDDLNSNTYIKDIISNELHEDDPNMNEDVNEYNLSFSYYPEITLENKAIGVPTIFSNEYFFNLNPNTSSSYIQNKHLHLGKKRLKTSTRLKQNDKVLIDYNFDTYFNTRIRKLSRSSNLNKSMSLSNISTTHYNLTTLKHEFEDLSKEIKNNRKHYLKLQESMVFLNSNAIDKFCNYNTFIALKNVLMLELKTENYKTDLFNYVLDKSLIKNYFYKKTSIFEDETYINTDNTNLPLTEGLKPLNERTEIVINEDDTKFIDKKDNLFVRKTTNKYLLTKKKVAPTITLVEKQLNSLENIEKYITPENFFKLIEQFIYHSYNKQKYDQTYIIIALLFNSKNFLSRNDYFSYNLFLYGIMSSFHIKHYKSSFELMKRNIVKYSLQNIRFFWMQLWNIGKNVPAKITRTFMYKLGLNRNFSKDVYLKLVIASCYFQTSNFDFALNAFKEVIQLQIDNGIPRSAYVYFMIALCYTFLIINRNSKNKEYKYIQAVKYLNLYACNRRKEFPIEVLYNVGRFYQFLGMDRIAYSKYKEALMQIMENEINNSNTHNNASNAVMKEEMKLKGCIMYNMVLIIKKGGNDEEAHNFICDNIII